MNLLSFRDFKICSNIFLFVIYLNKILKLLFFYHWYPIYFVGLILKLGFICYWTNLGLWRMETMTFLYIHCYWIYIYFLLMVLIVKLNFFLLFILLEYPFISNNMNKSLIKSFFKVFIRYIYYNNYIKNFYLSNS
jgi:hypothetical protein